MEVSWEELLSSSRKSFSQLYLSAPTKKEGWPVVPLPLIYCTNICALCGPSTDSKVSGSSKEEHTIISFIRRSCSVLEEYL